MNKIKPTFWMGAMKGYAQGSVIGGLLLTAYGIEARTPILILLGSASYLLALLCLYRMD